MVSVTAVYQGFGEFVQLWIFASILFTALNCNRVKGGVNNMLQGMKKECPICQKYSRAGFSWWEA